MEINKQLLNEFSKQVLNTDESFAIETKNAYYYFVQTPVGKAKYVYVTYKYNSKNIQSCIDNTLSVAAIVVDGTIYLVRPLLFNVQSEETISVKNVKLLNSDDINARINKNVFKPFFNSLPTKEISKDKLDGLILQARNMIIRKELLNEFTIGKLLTEQDTADELCGLINAEEKALSILEKDKEYWINKKSQHEKLKQLLNDTSIVEDWEIKLADAISTIDAKVLNVTFTFKNKSATVKILPYKITNHLIHYNFFDYYDFENSTIIGKQIIRDLGVNTNNHLNSDVLTCKHITKITYGKKVLFQK